MHQKRLREPITGVNPLSEDDVTGHAIVLSCDGEAQGRENMNEKEGRIKKEEEEFIRKIETIMVMWVAYALACIAFMIVISIYFEDYTVCAGSIAGTSNVIFLFLMYYLQARASRANILKYYLCAWILVVVILAFRIIHAACSSNCP